MSIDLEVLAERVSAVERLVILDLALGACAELHLGAPAGYADAFVRLAAAGTLDAALARRLAAAAGFHNLVAHAYESIDLLRVHHAATHGPADTPL